MLARCPTLNVGSPLSRRLAGRAAELSSLELPVRSIPVPPVPPHPTRVPSARVSPNPACGSVELARGREGDGAAAVGMDGEPGAWVGVRATWMESHASSRLLPTWVLGRWGVCREAARRETEGAACRAAAGSGRERRAYGDCASGEVAAARAASGGTSGGTSGPRAEAGEGNG